MIRREQLWPIGVVAVLAITVAANGVLLWAANEPGTAVVEDDYYRKALAWDSTMADARQSAALGWTLDLALVPLAGASTRIDAHLTDRDGRAVRGAELEIEAIHNLDPAHIVHMALAPAGEGYTTTAPLAHRGLWELRCVATRGGERFVTRLHRERAPLR